MLLHAIVPEDKSAAEAPSLSETSSLSTSHTILVGLDLAADGSDKTRELTVHPRTATAPGPAFAGSMQSGALPGQLIFPAPLFPSLSGGPGQSFQVPASASGPGPMPMQPGTVAVPIAGFPSLQQQGHA
eukprot:3932708-Rhodomonas_salina.1